LTKSLNDLSEHSLQFKMKNCVLSFSILAYCVDSSAAMKVFIQMK